MEEYNEQNYKLSIPDFGSTCLSPRAGYCNLSGYVVTDVHYTLNGGDPTLFTNVSIDLGDVADANNVYAGISLSGGAPASWVSCTLDAGTVWDCPLSGSVDTAEELHVAAAQ